MPSHKEIKNLNYSPKKILDLVMDIDNYPNFLPWCSNSKITNIIDESNLEADLTVNFKGIFHRYSSKVQIKKISQNCYEVEAVATNGPFSNLVNLWHIKEIEGQPDKCCVDFFIDFEFRSKILNKIIGPIFSKATNKMINAFEKRAEDLYS